MRASSPVSAGAAHHCLHIVTGPPGSGKSTLIAALAAAGLATSPEVGRQIIREQVAVGGTALPWGDEVRFADLMLPREIAASTAEFAAGTTVMLDRGVPDVAGFLLASGLLVPPALDTAARTCRYNPRLFLAPFWADIFVQDAERPQSAASAERTDTVMRAVYRRYDYTLLDLPRASVADRVAFVIAALEAGAGTKL